MQEDDKPGKLASDERQSKKNWPKNQGSLILCFQPRAPANEIRSSRFMRSTLSPSRILRIVRAAISLLAVPALHVFPIARAAPGGDPSPRLRNLSARASEIDPKAREHPELEFIFGTRSKPGISSTRASIPARRPAESSSSG